MSSRFYLTLCACMCFLGIGQSQPPFTEIPIDTLAYRGCSAQLNCSISDLGDTISWYAEVDGQYQQISSGNETYDKHFKVIGDHLMGEFHLFIDFVEKSIESVYECTVHQTGVSTAARLFVLESGPFCNVKGTSVIENLGSVTFTCWVDLPDDAPGQLVWRNNGKEVARTQEKTNYYMKRVFDRSEDGDEYTCIFEYQNAYICLELQSLNCSEEFIIDVQYPPDVSLRNAVGSSVAVIEGESYTNFCIVYSNPSATVEWIHGGKVVENYGLLDLQNVQRYQNGTYTCHANTTFWNSDSGSGSLSFKLDVQYSPEISLVGSNDDVVEGNTYSRVCSVKSNPAATVEWLYEEIFVTASNTLTLANVRRNLKGTYICQARNTFWQGENRTSSESFVLNVQYPPTVSTVERVERREGQSVSLTCNLESGNPAAEDNIGWVLLKGEMRFGTNLDLTNVTRDMTGYYTCVARNTFYDNTLGVGNSTTYVDVHYKPSVQRSKFSDKVEAEITANASLVCVVSANPTPTFKWHKDGKSVDGSSEETTEGTETTSTLTLTFVSNADYGEYISTATNDLLEDQCKIKLVRIELSSEDSTPWYWPAIIVTCSCLFIGGAVFLGCVLYKRRKSLLRQGNAQRTSLGSALEDFGQNRHEDEDRYQDLCFTETEEPGTGTDDIYMKLCERFHEFPREHVRMSQIIGTGSFGKVNMATASEIAGKSGMTVVAVKTVKDSASDDDKGRLMAELKILQRVEPHRNILPLLGCCTEEEPIYVIMELMGQGNLLKYLRDYRRERTSDYANAALMKWVIKSKDLVSFGRQIAIGMQYLASQSFVHGELAAKTVLLTNDKRTCKLSNIGLRGDNDIEAIRVKERKTRLPIRWFAPETLFSGEYSTMSDVWSFGIVLWEITTLGKTPYPTAKNVMKVNDFISKGYRMKRPVYCDSKLYSVMVRCWSENKTERPSFSELATELGSMAKSREDFIDVKKACADTPDYKKAANEKCYETN